MSSNEIFCIYLLTNHVRTLRRHNFDILFPDSFIGIIENNIERNELSKERCRSRHRDWDDQICNWVIQSNADYIIQSILGGWIIRRILVFVNPTNASQRLWSKWIIELASSCATANLLQNIIQTYLQPYFILFILALIPWPIWLPPWYTDRGYTSLDGSRHLASFGI